ncbi:hypothetical protein APF79_04245 [bacterium BRH_c32]|nr:MAG: hypothetical protein APF79_04245 [bacterium BRH_c32]
MIKRIIAIFSLLILAPFPSTYSQYDSFRFSLQGQASAWIISIPERSFISQAGVRYLPDILIDKQISNNLFLEAELSLNSFIASDFNNREINDSQAKLKLYRSSLRISTNHFELRAGLQKINFGSATLFRPLILFDKVDPRDPLKFTDGVYGLLARYYSNNNSNIWLWGLYGNNDLKGWEIFPTKKKSIEFGGRIQSPFLTGEAGLTYNHRQAEQSLFPLSYPLSNKHSFEENRFAFDGKWDIEIGVWIEAAFINRKTEILSLKHQRMITLGADYTFPVGNGLHMLSEFFNTENSEKLLGKGDGSNFAGVSADYPVGLFDNVSAFFYRDWTSKENYFTFNWQRTYDNWMIYFIGFLNPDNAKLNQTQSGNALAGNGVQIMVVFNH